MARRGRGARGGRGAPRGGPEAGPTLASPDTGRRPLAGRRALLAVLLLAAAAKGVVLAQLHDHPLLQPAGGLDTEVYVRLARQAAGGDWALGGEAFYVSPLYAYFLALVLKVTDSLLAARVLQVALGVAGLFLTWTAALRLFGPQAALVAAALAAATGVVTFNEVLILQSSLDPFLTALHLSLLARALQRGRPGDYVLTGAAIGLHALNRPNVLAWLAVLPLLLAVRRGRRRAALAVIAGGLVALSPAAVRNRVVAGEWVPVASHGGLNFYIGANPEADGTYRAVPGITPSIEGQARDARRLAEEATGRSMTAGEVSRWFYARGWQFIEDEPARALGLFARKLAYTVHASDLPLNLSFAYYRSDEPTLLRFLVVGPWILVPLGFVGVMAAASDPRVPGRLTWCAFMPVYAVAVAAFFVSGRYRLPLLIALWVVAGAGALHLAEAGRTRRPRQLGVAAAVFALGAVVANWPLRLDDGRAAERTEMIVWLVDQGRLDEARARLAVAARDHPTAALLHFRVGRALLDRGQAAPAVEELRRAEALDPSRPEVRLALGQALLDAGRPAEAAPVLEAARAAGAKADLAGFDLARALLSQNRRDEARRELARIVLPADADAASLFGLGQLALDLEDFERAEGLLARAVARAPSSAAALEAHSVALFRLQRIDEAAAALEKAAVLDPGSAGVRLNLAVLRARQGRYVEARALAAEALRLRPGYPQAKGLLTELDRIRER